MEKRFLIWALLIAVIAISCEDKSTPPPSTPDITVDLATEGNFPLVTITSEDSIGMQTLLCELAWADSAKNKLDCKMEKRKFANGHIYRVAVGNTVFSTGDELIGYDVDINGRTWSYGAGAGAAVECGESTEIPVIIPEVEVYPPSSISPYRAAAGISNVYFQVDQNSNFGCYFDAFFAADRKWLVLAIPPGSHYTPQTLWNSFDPDVAGDFVVAWKVITPAGEDADTICFTAVSDHYMLALGPSVYPNAPGMSWDGAAVWYFSDYNVLTRLSTTGVSLATMALPDSVNEASGICALATEIWVTGRSASDNLKYIFKFGKTGVPLSRIPLGEQYTLVDYDGADIWVGAPQERLIGKLDLSGNVLTTFAAPDTLDEVTGISCGAGHIWVSGMMNGTGGVISLSTDGAVQTIYNLEFVIPQAIAFDGINLWCVNGIYASPLTQLDIP